MPVNGLSLKEELNVQKLLLDFLEVYENETVLQKNHKIVHTSC